MERATNTGLLSTIDRMCTALACHINEQRADDEDAPICVHVAEAYDLGSTVWGHENAKAFEARRGESISEQWAERASKCKLLHEWAMRFDGLDPAKPRDRGVILTDDNPYIKAWEHARMEYAMNGPANCIEGFER